MDPALITAVFVILVVLVALLWLSREAERRVRAERLSRRVLALLADPSVEEQELVAAVTALLNADHAIATRRLLQILHATDIDVAARRTVIAALGLEGRQSAARIEEARRSKGAPASAAYWFLLAKLVRTNQHRLAAYILPTLAAALHDPDPAIRSGAVASLKEIGTPEASAILAGNASAEPSVARSSFAAYSPKEVPPDSWAILRAYWYLDSATTAVLRDVESQFARPVVDLIEAEARADAFVSAGDILAAEMFLDGCLVEVPRLAIPVRNSWHRFAFSFKPTNRVLDTTVHGSVVFSINGLIVADVAISCHVTSDVGPSEMGRAIAAPYQKIFCCYSHRDEAVVRRAEAAYKALGMDYRRDKTTLKSGMEWGPELARLIDGADVFQLFWSADAAISDNVRREWSYAAALGRGNFIRPVYWLEPLPAVPPELAHIHFTYEPILG